MSSTRRRTFTAGLAVLAVLVSSAALAWACTPQANISLNVGGGAPGSQIIVTGADFAPGGPVEITWNGGQTLATATGPSFSVAVTVPNAPAETHTIVAVGREINGSVAGRARASFTITGVAPTPAGQTPSESTAGGGGGSPGSSSGSASGGEATAGGGSGATASGGERTTVRGGGGTAAAGGGAAGEPVLATSNSVFADSTVESEGRGAAAVGARKAGSATPSARSAAAGLWSGFAKGSAPSLANASGAPEGGSVPGLTLALLALGLTTVLAGVGVAGARRRRATAGSSD